MANPRKVIAMLDWPTPSSLKSLRGFLGITGYYCKFIKNYGTVATPLTNLLKKNAFVWNEVVAKAFEELKSVVNNPPVLKLPYFSQPFTIKCDASGRGMGTILMQARQRFTFMSKALKGKTLILSTYKNKLLALVTAVRKWRPYLLGQSFIVKTNQQALKFLLEQRVGTVAQHKWVSKLMGYDFVISYKKRKEIWLQMHCRENGRKGTFLKGP